MDPFSSYGIDLNDPSNCIDMNKLSDVDADRMPEIKRFFSNFFGEDFANRAESVVVKGGSIAKKRKLHDSSTRTKPFHSRLSPIITKSHTVSFYDDPRDKIPLDLIYQEDSVGAEHCCGRCQLMTGTVKGLRALMSAEGKVHYTCDEIKQQSAGSGCPFCEQVRRIIVSCGTCAQSAIGEGIIRVRAIAEEDDAADEHPFRPGPRLEALQLEIPLDPERSCGHDSPRS